jgi:hypothetical protein
LGALGPESDLLSRLFIFDSQNKGFKIRLGETIKAFSSVHGEQNMAAVLLTAAGVGVAEIRTLAYMSI